MEPGQEPTPLPRMAAPGAQGSIDNTIWWPIAINSNGYVLGRLISLYGSFNDGVVWKPDGTAVYLPFAMWSGSINDNNEVITSGCGRGLYGSYCGMAKWDLGSEKIVVEVSVDYPEVGPVLSGYFDAIAQDWEEIRYDLIKAKVRVYKQGSSTPVPNATLVLSSTAQDGSGGHTMASHGGVRPNGTFWLPGQDPNAVAGVRNSITVPVAAIETIYPYLTSGVSGTERLTAAVTVDGKTTTASVDVTIQFNGLHGMARTGSTYEFTDQNGAESQRHGNINHFAQPAFTNSAGAAFQRYFDKVPIANRFSGGATRFLITEASLEHGGLLDVGKTMAWRNPHRAHRTGTDLDVGYATVKNHVEFEKACRYIPVTCQIHCNLGDTDLTNCPLDTQRHYHLSP
jgi:hypothetical protein